VVLSQPGVSPALDERRYRHECNEPKVLVAVAALGLCWPGQQAFAQSNCKQLKGEIVVRPQPGTTVGTITNGGYLNGTFTAVDTSAFATPDPNVVSYTQDLIISTHMDQLTATSVWLFDFSKLPIGAVSGMARIGPTSAKTGNTISTGRFAGATGFYFLTGPDAPDAAGNSHGDITGQICYP
jgi:hypothetical protein